jgi:hypothetical protein
MSGTKGPLETRPRGPVDDAARSRYFQDIARRFLKHRGAPFFLSAKDLDLIAAWERAGIPLAVVLQGLDMSFDTTRPPARPRGKVLALSYCQGAVARAFELARDRNVGGKRTEVPPRDKRASIRAEIETYLERTPPAGDVLRELMEEIRKTLLAGPVADEELERRDEAVDGLLLSGASADDRAAAHQGLPAGFKKLSPSEQDQALRTRLVKYLRDTRKVPYLSPFYY